MLSKAMFKRSDPFNSCTSDAEKLERVLREPAAERSFVIYFTPRSGSSWLTKVIHGTGRLGMASEAFNPNFIPSIAKSIGAGTLEEYIVALRSRQNTSGVFSFEITYHQLAAVFPDEETFASYFGDCPAVWLIRRDIVAQAVSLAKMVTTSVAHSNQLAGRPAEALDQLFEYDAGLIKRWLEHILTAERKTEKLFESHAVNPLRLSYEEMFARGADRTLQSIADHVGVRDLSVQKTRSELTKIGTRQNEAFAAQFRQDAAAFLERIDRIRQPWVSRLDGRAPVDSRSSAVLERLMSRFRRGREPQDD